MHESHNTLALHLNDLTLANLPEVRRALQWYASHIETLHTIHLLHLRLRMPPQAMCLASAESLYYREYQAAQAQLVAWRDLLSIPECTGWLHEGISRIELRHFCHEHHFDYLLTRTHTAKQIKESKLSFRRKQIDIVEQFDSIALLSMHKQSAPMVNVDTPNDFAIAVGCI